MMFFEGYPKDIPKTHQRTLFRHFEAFRQLVRQSIFIVEGGGRKWEKVSFLSFFSLSPFLVSLFFFLRSPFFFLSLSLTHSLSLSLSYSLSLSLSLSLFVGVCRVCHVTLRFYDAQSNKVSFLQFLLSSYEFGDRPSEEPFP